MINWNLDNYRQVFRYPSFRRFWVGFTLSVLGDTMTRVALTWFVYETTGSARALGWLTLFYTGPVIVGGLLAGWLLDRFERRTVMLIDSLVRGGGVILIPGLYAMDQLALWHIYAVAGLHGLLMMISLAGGPSLVPALVPKQHLATANALETLSFTLGGVIGPPVAGFLIGRLGAPNVIILDAVSYGVFALALSRVKPIIEAGVSAQVAQPTYHLKAAIQLLLKKKILLSTTLMFMSANFGIGAMFVWLPIFSDRTLGGGSELYGLLLGFLSAGEVISSVLAGTLTLSLSLGLLICLGQFLAGIALGLLLLGQSLWGTAAGLTLFGLFSAPLTIWAQTLRMQIIPEPLRGRTFALLRMLMQGTNPLGGVMAGLLLPSLGLPALIGLSALLVGGPGLIGHRLKELRLGQNEIELT
ncbi:MAG TPA: MFS transporter, partial [Anaerolineae bacterium]